MPHLKSYQDILDRFSTIALFAPDFNVKVLKHGKLTLEEMMGELIESIKDLAARTSNSEVLELFDQCLEKLHSAFELYKNNEVRQAKLGVRSAEQLFLKAGKLRKDKTSAERVEDDYQEDQDRPPPRTTTH